MRAQCESSEQQCKQDYTVFIHRAIVPDTQAGFNLKKTGFVTWKKN
jgi:hypothetical protein